MNLFLAAITGSTILNVVIWLVVAGLIYWILTWGLSQISLPEPFAKIAQVLLVLVVVIFVINALLTLVGSPFISFG